jgi:hypothetical protein
MHINKVQRLGQKRGESPPHGWQVAIPASMTVSGRTPRTGGDPGCIGIESGRYFFPVQPHVGWYALAGRR